MPSCISITAPRFTDEDERREKESLSAEEAAQVQADLYGTKQPPQFYNDSSSSLSLHSISSTTTTTTTTMNRHEELLCENEPAVAPSPVEETPEMIAMAVRLMHEALAQIPDHEKVDYSTALVRCPVVVHKESPDVGFLRAEFWDAWAAARRKVQYWAVRRAVFGDTAFCLPLTLGHKGALSEAAVALLDNGYYVPLPPDHQGRPVLYYDRSKLGEGRAFREAMLQVNMYSFHAFLDEYKVAQEQGFVFLVNGKSASLSFDQKLARATTKFYRCLPARFLAVHVCIPDVRPPFQFIMPVIKFMLPKAVRLRLVLHCGKTLYEIRKSLARYGLGPSENLPRHCTGGEFPWEQAFQRFMLTRRQREIQREEEGYYDAIE